MFKRMHGVSCTLIFSPNSGSDVRVKARRVDSKSSCVQSCWFLLHIVCQIRRASAIFDRHLSLASDSSTLSWSHSGVCSLSCR